MARPDFKPAFGAHPVPQLLDDLGEFAMDVKGGHFAGRFKLGPADATGWLGGPELASHFALFGHDQDGSQYGFWLYDDRTPANAPIVYLSAAHSGSCVLAESLEDFLGLLAHDVTDLGLFYDEADRPHKHSAGHAAYVAWLHDCFGMAPLPGPARAVKRAAAAHPKLVDRYGKRGA